MTVSCQLRTVALPPPLHPPCLFFSPFSISRVLQLSQLAPFLFPCVGSCPRLLLISPAPPPLAAVAAPSLIFFTCASCLAAGLVAADVVSDASFAFLPFPFLPAPWLLSRERACSAMENELLSRTCVFFGASSFSCAYYKFPFSFINSPSLFTTAPHPPRQILYEVCV